MSAAGASDASSADARPSRTTVTRRSLSVSCASGVTCPRRASTTVSPRASTRASASVMISNRFIAGMMLAPMAELRPSEILLSADADSEARRANWRWRSARDFPDDLHIIAVLKGAFMFLSDLVRHMAGHVSLDFMAVSSYAKGTTSSGEVRLLKDLDTALDGRNVVIVEDIVDTGLTLTYLQDILRARNPQVAAHRVPAEQAVAPQGRRQGRIHRLHDRGPLRRRLRPRLRRAVPQPAAHRRARANA